MVVGMGAIWSARRKSIHENIYHSGIVRLQRMDSHGFVKDEINTLSGPSVKKMSYIMGWSSRCEHQYSLRP